MKKVISILLATVIMCSFTLFAFAADGTITEGKTYTFTVTKDETVDLDFVATENAVYSVDVAFENPAAVKNSFVEASVLYKHGMVNTTYIAKFEKALTDEANEFFDLIFDNVITNKNELLFVGEKDKSFSLELEMSNWFDVISSINMDNSVNVTVKISKAETPEFKIGNTYTVDSSYSVYIATPQIDTVYNITSDVDYLNVEINDITGSVGTYNFFDEAVNYTFKLKGGKTYAIVLSTDEECTPYDVKVSDGSKILPEEIVTDDVLYLVKGEQADLFLRINPYGSEVNSEGIEVTVENEKIASIEYDEYFECYTVTGLRAGKTTFTVTDKTTGISTTGKIVVDLPIVSFFRNIFFFIEMIFNSIFNIFS